MGAYEEVRPRDVCRASGNPFFSTPNGRSDGILKCDVRAHLRTRVATTRARSSRASEMRLQRHPLGEARVLAKRVAASRSPPFNLGEARNTPNRLGRNDTNERLKAHSLL